MNSKNAAADEIGPDEDAPDAVPLDSVEHEPNAATQKLHEMLDEVHGDPTAEPQYQDASRRLTLLAAMPRIRGQLTQAAVAAAMGTTQSAISELESGKVDPQLRTLQRYARAINRRLDFGLVDEELPTFDEGTANGLWRLVERNSLSPLLTALAIETEKGQLRHLKEIADFVNVPPTVMRPMLASLCRMGWVTNSGYGDDQLYSLISDAAYVIGVSIHHDRVAGALVDLSTRVVPGTYIAMPLPDSTRGAVIETAISVMTRLHHAAEGHQVLGVGVSIAGVVSTQQLGLVHFAPDLASPADAWCGVPLQSSLEEEIRRKIDPDPHLHVVVENDANALAMREYLQNGDQSVAVVLLTGAGIGMGSVIGGNVIRGANSGAGEGGHTILDPHGPACRVAFDNHRGCLETLASAKGIIDALGIDLPSSRIEEGLAIANDRVKRLEPAAMNAFKDAALALGRFVSLVIAVLDPSRIVFYAHRELAQERPGWPSGVLFRDTVDQALRTALPKDGGFAQAQVDWRVLDEHVNAAAAGAGAMREFLQRPVDWRPSVLPIRTVGTSVF